MAVLCGRRGAASGHGSEGRGGKREEGGFTAAGHEAVAGTVSGETSLLKGGGDVLPEDGIERYRRGGDWSRRGPA